MPAAHTQYFRKGILKYGDVHSLWLQLQLQQFWNEMERFLVAL